MGVGGSLAWLSLAATAGAGITYDANAQAFFTAATITDTTQKAATDQLVKDLKANGTWGKYHAIYPFVGGTAAQHSYNLKNPANFQVAWSGTVTHDANGITGSSNGFGNTGYIPSVNATLANNHISVYCRGNLVGSSGTEFCCSSGFDAGTNAEWAVQLKDPTGSIYFILLGGSYQYPSVALSNSQGWFVATRPDNNVILGFKNTGQILGAGQVQFNTPTVPLTLLAQNSSGTMQRHSVANLAHATIGLHLTPAEIAADYAAFQTFQTTLGRQV